MIKNHIRAIWRSFRTDRNYALTSLLGLSVAFAVVVVILGYVRYELSFDKYYSNSDNVYRLVWWDKTRATYSSTLRESIGYDLEISFPEVESVTFYQPIYDGDKITMRSDYGTASTSITHIDTAFFDVFDIKFTLGSRLDTRTMGTVVLTKTVADQLFPNQDPIGKSITRPLHGGNTHDHIVCAVVDDIPANSHFRADIFFVSTKIDREPLNFKGAYSARSQYVLLKEGVSHEDFQRKINAGFYEKGMSKDAEIILLPVQNIHLHASHIEHIGGNVQNARFVYMFALSGILILLIGCINHINLYLARLIPKGKEMGIRKVLGARERHLIVQILVESGSFFLLALPIAVLVAYICWPIFAHLLEIPSEGIHLINIPNILMALGVALFSSCIVSIYPAIRLKNEDAIDLLRQKTGKLRLTLAPQKALVVFQFVIAVVLVIATLVIHAQVQFFVNRSMGFDKDYLLMLSGVVDKTDVLKDELLKIPTIDKVSFANRVKVGEGYGARGSMMDPRDSTLMLSFGFMDADLDFIPTMRAELIQGRQFTYSDALQAKKIDHEESDEPWTERASRKPIIITESTANRLDIRTVDTALSLGALQGTVVGIVKDFQLTSFREEGPYAVFRPAIEANRNAYVRIANHDIPKTLARMQGVWKDIFPHDEFNYHFVDDQIRAMYKKENQLASLFTIFSLIGIGISALGLLSLIALMVKQRTKEIGIRKVLGASVSSIVVLLSRDFVKLVFLGIIIASPLAWWAMNKWLEDFAYRIDIKWWMFVGAGLLAIMVALATVSSQAIRAALVNPVESLRDE